MYQADEGELTVVCPRDHKDGEVRTSCAKEGKEDGMKALALFCKGKAEILGRMRKRIAERLSQESEAFRTQIAQEFDLAETDVERLKVGTMTVDFSLFDRLKGVLGIPIQDVLGPPRFTNGARLYWERQCQSESPMFFAAPSKEPEGAGDKENIPDKKERKRIELELYVRLRAIDELAWDK